MEREKVVYLDFVLKASFGISPAHDGLDLPLLTIDDDGDLEALLLLRGELAGDLGSELSVLTVLVPPSDVLVGGLVHVHLDVVEGVLGDVGHAEVGVLPHLTGGGLDLSCEHLDDGGLAGSVGTEDSNTRV